MNKMVVTNWRTDVDTYSRAKSWAAGLGMSVNEYINYVVDVVGRSEFLGVKPRLGKKVVKRDPYAPMWELLRKPYRRVPMSLSDEDKAIYGE